MLSRYKFELSDLANEMLDKIPAKFWHSTTAKILDPDMGGGQFLVAVVKRLRTAGHSDTNINKRVFGIGDAQWSVNYVRNKHKLLGNLSVGNFLEDSSNKKYD